MRATAVLMLVLGTSITTTHADEVRERMDRARKTGEAFKSLMRDPDVRPFWSDCEDTFFFRANSEAGGHRFFRVNLRNGGMSEAFDHDSMATALAGKNGGKPDPEQVPVDHLEATPAPNVLRILANGKAWLFKPGGSSLAPDDLPLRPAAMLTPAEALSGTRQNGPKADLTISNKTDGPVEMLWIDGRGTRKSYGKLDPGKETTISSHIGHVWLFTDAGGTPLAGARVTPFSAPAVITCKLPSNDPGQRHDGISPDGRWKALIRDHNLAIIPTGGGEPVFQTGDGTPALHWDGPVLWSPDSTRLVAFKTREVDVRKIHIVRSSPPDQVQPQLQTFDYPKPGDPIRQSKPRLIHLEERAEIPVDDALFDNPWSINRGEWTADSGEFIFLYNQRGHQVVRIIGIDGVSGAARSIHEERSTTFIDYSQKTFFKHLPDSGEILWASERDGYNHLYLIDRKTGRIRNPVTTGTGNVREVVDVDIAKRSLLVRINVVEGQDPYHDHFARVSFDGTGFTRLTDGDGSHRIVISPDGKLLLDTWSRVDQPPVVELRDAVTGRRIAGLSRGDDSALVKAGWQKPERFVAKGRDGRTDIFGVIYRPTGFDPSVKYPVLEDIYAGPHDFFVPKEFGVWNGCNQKAELGFVVVKIDGMGTNWRGKAFHDVCWKNLMDSGFPDRIPWIKAAAATRPWMDLSRVGIQGGSAGGQSTLAGLLHHGDFYKVGVADCGCHDNRMDKIWWNEAWMGWPVDESYARNSNVTHAEKLTGKLMLVVGEVDRNVDPASTAQVVAALQKAGKSFEYVPVMNAGHGAAETPYGSYRRAEFLMRNLR